MVLYSAPRVSSSPQYRLHPHQVDNTLELVLLPPRNLKDQGVCFQALFDHFHSPEKISAHAVQFVDKGNLGHSIAIRLAPDRLRLRFYTTHRTKDTNGAIQYTQRTFHLNGKIHMSPACR